MLSALRRENIVEMAGEGLLFMIFYLRYQKLTGNVGLEIVYSFISSWMTGKTAKSRYWEGTFHLGLSRSEGSFLHKLASSSSAVCFTNFRSL